MIFKFSDITVTDPVPFSGGRRIVYRPIISLGIRPLGGTGRQFREALIDTGADATLFPLDVAADLSLDLSTSPRTRQTVANGGRMRIRYAEVELTLAASAHHFIRWRAAVGFGAVPRPVFGFLGGLEFFDLATDWVPMRFSLSPNPCLPALEMRLPSADHAIATRY